MNINSRWLYRAAGTVGIAGGFLALAAGSAQADDADRMDPESMNGVVGDVFSPTSGLPPLDLGATDPAASGDTDSASDRSGPADTGGLRLDPNDGRLDRGAPELLPGLPAVPTGGVDSLLGGLPLGDALNQVPLDGVGVPGGSVGTGGPTSQLLDVDGELLNTPGLPAISDATTLPAPAGGGLSLLPAPTGGGPSVLPAPADGAVHTLPAPADAPRDRLDAAANAAGPAESSGPAEVIGPMPFLTQPVTDAVLGGQSLGDLVTVGDLAGQVPVAGPVVSQTTGSLPLVSDLAPGSHHQQLPGQQTTPVAPAGLIGQSSQTAAGTGEQVPAVIGDQLEAGFTPGLLDGAPAGRSPELLPGGLPFVGDGLGPVSQLVGVGDLSNQLPVVGPLAGSALGDLPVVGNPGAAGPATAGPAPAGPAPAGPAPLGPGPAGPAPAADPAERPIAGDDPEFAESAELLPGDPVGGLTQQLPVPSPLQVLRTLPLVGDVSGVLPL